MTTHHEDCARRAGAHARTPFPDVYMPAMPPLRHIEALSRWIDTLQRRRALRQLLKINDRLLQDLGLSRERVRQAIDRVPNGVAQEKGNHTCEGSRRI